MKYKEIAKKIIALKNADLEFRGKLIEGGELGDGYNDEMAKIHIQKMAPGPPTDSAVATPAIFPIPTVPARDVAAAWTGVIIWPRILLGARRPIVFRTM